MLVNLQLPQTHLKPLSSKCSQNVQNSAYKCCLDMGSNLGKELSTAHKKGKGVLTSYKESFQAVRI
eukprot:5023223-Amphidinium_carterae.1